MEVVAIFYNYVYIQYNYICYHDSDCDAFALEHADLLPACIIATITSYYIDKYQ